MLSGLDGFGGGCVVVCEMACPYSLPPVGGFQTAA